VLESSFFLAGNVYFEMTDVIEEFAVGMPSSFESLSWDDGRIAFEFARHELNDKSAIGIWHLPNERVLRPKPETIIRSKFGKFLQFRMAGYRTHTEEAHVENDGYADVSLHFVDDRVVIVEVKWIGAALVSTRLNEPEADIKAALKGNKAGWFTRFGDSTFASGLAQVVTYFESGKYQKAYLAVFDCGATASTTDSCDMPVDPGQLNGQSVGRFRVVRACVDPRTASKKAKA